jgi:hypothetical protein
MCSYKNKKHAISHARTCVSLQILMLAISHAQIFSATVDTEDDRDSDETVEEDFDDEEAEDTGDDDEEEAENTGDEATDAGAESDDQAVVKKSKTIASSLRRALIITFALVICALDSTTLKKTQQNSTRRLPNVMGASRGVDRRFLLTYLCIMTLS